MWQLVNLQINKQLIPLFSFLKGNPSRTLAKDNHFLLTYYKPPNLHILPFSYKGITVTTSDTDDLESYLKNGWLVARDYQIASVGDKLGGILDELEQEYLSRHRAGCPLPINGLVFDWIAYGIADKESVTKFVKVFYLNGYTYEQIVMLYASLTRRKQLNAYFLETINNIYKEELDERVFEPA